MAQREKPIFVYDADGFIGVVMEFSESDFEAYSMPHLALIGAFRTKAQAAQALASRSRQLRLITGARQRLGAPSFPPPRLGEWRHRRLVAS
jgi:hypothetical protein